MGLSYFMHIFNFYSFVYRNDYLNKSSLESICDMITSLKAQMKNFCLAHDIKGTIILAKEGINGALTGALENLELFNEIILSKCYEEINFKFSKVKMMPFSKLKVKSKSEAVAIKVTLSTKNKGEYIKPEDWDNLISKPDAVVIDVRNDYECIVGTFKNAINPKTENFREFPSWVDSNIDKFTDKKVYMFCTGGIRCEKSTALLKERGLDKVYHLKGGILDYLYTTKNKNNLWQGKCFVFDDRNAVEKEDYL